jgi:hypothetical protein
MPDAPEGYAALLVLVAAGGSGKSTRKVQVTLVPNTSYLVGVGQSASPQDQQASWIVGGDLSVTVPGGGPRDPPAGGFVVIRYPGPRRGTGGDIARWKGDTPDGDTVHAFFKPGTYVG